MSAIRLTVGEKAYIAFNYVIVSLISLLFLLPFLMVLMTSFLSNEEFLRRGMVLVPEKFALASYRFIFKGARAILKAYQVTVFRTVVGTALQLAATTTMAYALSKAYLPGRSFITSLLIGAMIIPLLLVPRFLVVKTLGLVDTVWALIFPWLINTQYVFLMKAFYTEVPGSIEESAILDGCNPVQVFIYIMMPLTMASMATIGLFYAVWHWNEWFDAAMFINDSNRLPMQNFLRTVIMSSTYAEYFSDFVAEPPPSDSVKGAVIVITTLPILCVYPFIQKYFVKGFMMGSLKG